MPSQTWPLLIDATRLKFRVAKDRTNFLLTVESQGNPSVDIRFPLSYGPQLVEQLQNIWRLLVQPYDPKPPRDPKANSPWSTSPILFFTMRTKPSPIWRHRAGPTARSALIAARPTCTAWRARRRLAISFAMTAATSSRLASARSWSARISHSQVGAGLHLMAASKKGMSSKQIQRMLGVSYKSAWFMTMRMREAMQPTPRQRAHRRRRQDRRERRDFRRRQEEERPQGQARAQEACRACAGRAWRRSARQARCRRDRQDAARSASSRRPAASQNCTPTKRWPTTSIGKEFAEHRTVNHTLDEYLARTALACSPPKRSSRS